MRGRLVLHLELDNAAFCGEDDSLDGAEVGRILRELATGLENGDECPQSGSWKCVHDLNGNTVGTWGLD